MISNIILIICIILTIVPYILLLITYFTNNKDYKITASENILKLLDNDNNINFIENKDSYFSHYNIKRRIIKLSSKTYDSKKYFHIAVSSLLAGYSLIKIKSMDYLSYIINNLKIITILPIISIILSIYARNTKDAKIAIIILVLIGIIQYLINTLTTLSINTVKIKEERINKILNVFLVNTKIYFICTLLQILRLVIVVLNI